MSNDELIEAIVTYPYLIDIYLYGESVNDGINTSRKYFSALDELLSRSDGLDSLQAKIANNIERTSVADSSTSYSFSEKALADIFMSQAPVVDINNDVSTYVNYRFIYTPQDTAVRVYNITENCTESDHSTRDAEIVRTYSVSLIKEGTCCYNCHYFAWHLRGATNVSSSSYGWMNNPTAYMTDGSYNRIYSGSLNTVHYTTSITRGDVIFYGDLEGDMSTWHTAICTYSSITGGPLSSLTCISKWGAYGVFEHAMGNVPAEYDSSLITAWRIA